jgi:D-alanyl-D-alanine carboxypeptidase/D-alanyl-D-alanine-endopeptidase (penicillin-binding protein 4)
MKRKEIRCWLMIAVKIAMLICVLPPFATAQDMTLADVSKATLTNSSAVLPNSTLQQLRALLSNPGLSDARVGVSILALGKVDNKQQFPSRPFLAGPLALFEQDADKRFMPASNMKLYTAALALKILGSKKRFTTRVFGQRQIPPDQRPSLMSRPGPLILVGGGDPALNLHDLKNLAQQVKAAGVARYDGLLVNNSYLGAETFGGRYPEGWTLDDSVWYYGPEVSALAFNRNQVDVIVTGGARPGDGTTVQLEPELPGFRLGRELVTNITTGTAELATRSEEELLPIERASGSNQERTVRISGAVAPRQKVTFGLAVPDPALWAAHVFRSELARAGVVCNGNISFVPSGKSFYELISPPIAVCNSEPVGTLLKKFLKSSDNLYGEMLLRLAARESTASGAALGAQVVQGNNAASQAHALLRIYLQSEKIDTSALRFSDGSGLSRYNLITPRATAELLAAVERLPGGEAFWEAMPIAGVDGTLRTRMTNTPAHNNARAKTGTFSIVSCLSGYVTTRDGTRLAVSTLTNFARNGDDARRLQNEILVLLAGTEL